LAVSRANENYVYAVTVKDNGFVYGQVSTNGGFNFSDTVRIGFGYGMAFTFLFVHASPFDENVAFVSAGVNLYRTTDAGRSYSNLSTPYPDQNNFDFCPDPDKPNQVILANDGGLWRSSNLGDSWENLNSTLSFCEDYRITSNPYDPENIFIAQTDNGFLQKNRNSIIWTSRMFCCDGTNIIYSKFNNNVLIASTGVNWNMRETIWNSTNRGQSFNYHLIDGIWDGGNDWIAALAEDPVTDGTFYHPRRRTDYQVVNIWRTQDNGNSWVSSPNNGISPISVNDSGAPQTFTFCEKNPQIIYVSTRNFSSGSRLYKSIDGGENWRDLEIYNGGVANRFVTNVTTDPANEDVLYLTVSGFGTGHVFKSTNAGGNWHDISGLPTGTGLPDLPVNYFVMRYTSCDEKELIAATDAGVYRSLDDGNFVWKELAEDLPNTISMGLDLNLLSGKLRVSTFGRGVWETNLPGAIYVKGTQILNSDPATSGLEVVNDIIVCSGGKLRIPYSCTIKMKEGKKIIVMDGGEIDASSGSPVTLTSQSGTWGGIEIRDLGFGTLRNVTFENTTFPLDIHGPIAVPEEPPIVVDDCHFNNLTAGISVNGHDNVTIKSSEITFGSGGPASTSGILISGSNNVILQDNIIDFSQYQGFPIGIAVFYGQGVNILDNYILGASTGISLSNASPFVKNNQITSSNPQSAGSGISCDNCYAPELKYNTISGYQIGFWFYNSYSPIMYWNSSIYNGTAGQDIYGLGATYNSYPILAPSGDGGETILEAGFNTLRVNQSGSGIYVNVGKPVLDYGSNTIFGANYYLFGETGSPDRDWFVRCNDWVDRPEPDPNKFNVSDQTVVYSPYIPNCDLGGGGLSITNYQLRIENYEPIPVESSNLQSEIFYPEPPPPPIIVNHGGNVFDTITVINRTLNQTADRLLLSQGSKQMLLGNYSSAVNSFMQLIQNYQDSTTAIIAMAKLMQAKDKMNADTAAYSQLRNYYLGLAESNPSDTVFVKAATELAAKCLVRMNRHPAAITSYEGIINNSSDSLEILCAELNIIETYLLIQQGGGNSPGFTGQLAYLKPMNAQDALRMITERRGKIAGSQKEINVPKEYSLSQNYPNPFNAMTKINYSLPKPGKVTIKLYDILGRLVKELVNEFKDAGYYTLSFDGSNLASGVYFYRFESGSFVDTRKMVIIR
jgi:photosystem II stability/assembly factor-like uncharacterized protein/tetratricopeptide (TPR) repeat protein